MSEREPWEVLREPFNAEGTFELTDEGREFLEKLRKRHEAMEALRREVPRMWPR